MFLLYEVLLYLVFFVTLPFFLLFGLLRGKYVANFRERFGLYRTEPGAHDLWIHAVSVGEAQAAKTIVDEIARQRPGTSVILTTTTITGQAQAARLFPQFPVTYFPFDFSRSVGRFLDHHRPRVFATMETEIWPNVTRICRARGLRLILANGRISDRSFPRYRAARSIVGAVLRDYDRILAREETDRTRFIAIGAPPTIVETTGNVKFDYTPDQTPLPAISSIRGLIAGRPVLVLGSTMEGEDEALLPLLPDLIAGENAFVIIAPRKPERFDVVASLLAGSGLRFARRSEIDGAPPCEVLLLDSLGELTRIYALAGAAFVGGTLQPFGGHNPIEPAAAGVPVCFGPSMTNFREIAEIFLRDGGAAQVGSAAGVIAFARRMLADETLRSDFGERARNTVLQNRGASERTAGRIVELLA
ncbi:MAG: 3-deoxy-D-manno-octulosonic acid transferase [Acidobacteriota bacterium]